MLKMKDKPGLDNAPKGWEQQQHLKTLESTESLFTQRNSHDHDLDMNCVPWPEKCLETLPLESEVCFPCWAAWLSLCLHTGTIFSLVWDSEAQLDSKSIVLEVFIFYYETVESFGKEATSAKPMGHRIFFICIPAPGSSLEYIFLTKVFMKLVTKVFIHYCVHSAFVFC